MTITQSSSTPLVAVVGATGQQGGSVIKALAESNKEYRIRGFTRDVTKPAAEALKKQGVEMVQISLVVENVKEVYAAFAGANVAFLVTNFWEHLNVQREVDEGKMLIDAAKAAGVARVIWSGLNSIAKLSGGRYTHVYHFDGKAAVTEYARQSGVPFVDVQAGFYGSNFLTMVARQSDGTFAIEWAVKPTTVMPIIDAGSSSVGSWSCPSFRTARRFTSSEDISVEDIASQLSAATGKSVVFKQITVDAWKTSLEASGTPPPIVTDVLEAFQFMDEVGYYAGHPSVSHEGLARPTRSWAEYAKATDWSKALA